MTIVGDDWLFPVHSVLCNSSVVLFKKLRSPWFSVVNKSTRFKREALKPVNRSRTRCFATPSINIPGCSRVVAFEFLKTFYEPCLSQQKREQNLNNFTPEQFKDYCKLVKRFLGEEEHDEVKNISSLTQSFVQTWTPFFMSWKPSYFQKVKDSWGTFLLAYNN